MIVSPEPTAGAPQASTRLRLSRAQAQTLREMADRAYPFEGCGLLIGRADAQRIEVERVTQAPNRASSRHRFDLDPAEFLTGHREARAVGLDVVGFWHSHVDQTPDPSEDDRRAAWGDRSYLIVSIDPFGSTVLRSWRLDGETFAQESIEIHGPEPVEETEADDAEDVPEDAESVPRSADDVCR